MPRILLTMFAVLLTLTALGCERRLAGARPSGVRHIVAVATAPRAVDVRARALQGPHGAPASRHGSLRATTASTPVRATARAGTRGRGRSLWLSSDIEDDDDGSRGAAGADGDDPTTPTCAEPVPDAIGVDRLGTSSGPIASGVGPSLGHIRITTPPPRARAFA